MSCNNYCDSCGKCTRCGECCAAFLPITRKEEKRIKKYVKQNNIEPEFFQTEKDINLKLSKLFEISSIQTSPWMSMSI